MSGSARSDSDGDSLPDVLLVVGASGRAAAFSALRVGITPVVADLYADADLEQCCRATRIDGYPHGLLDFFRTAPRAPWLYTGGLENHPRLVSRLAVERPLYGNPASVLRTVRDPARLAAALAGRNLHFPTIRTFPAVAGRDGAWLRKPRLSIGGTGIEVWNGARAESGRGGAAFYLQRRIEGRPYAALFVAARGRARLLGITRQLIGTTWTGADGFRYSGSVGPIRPAAAVVDSFHRIGAALSDRFGLEGLFGVDAIVCGEEVWTVEVNPRYTASVEVLERALNLHAVAIHIRACRDGHLPPAPDWGEAPSCGKAILFARRTLRVTQAFADYVRPCAGTTTWPDVADIPAPGAVIRARAPVATALAAGPDSRSVLRLLRARVAEMQRQLSG